MGIIKKNKLSKLFIKLINVFRILTRNIRTLPDFLIIGASRCGTTSLYNYLVKHPNIKSARVKEVHFFDLNYFKGVDWYKSFFPTKFYKFIMTRLSHRDFLTGEASPSYITHPHAAKRVYSNFPKIKIIILLRNPIDRAYSQYHHILKGGREKISFDKAIVKENDRINGELDKMIKNEFYKSPYYPAFAYLTRGLYINQIKPWLNYFPEEQILIVKSENLFQYPKGTLKEIFKFLNLPNWVKIKFIRYHSEANSRGMDLETRNYLIEYFKPYNQQLSEYLDSKFDWDKLRTRSSHLVKILFVIASFKHKFNK
ncbi:hypothetical protein LCGC14_0877340 [marine sediment metagenome]|uniref:Sulfotransferase domain-containing protein n=1 Tax=marine sediment metagenome TaxID=412755 RepID=A0A0F9P2X0_9ZZZZ|nr:sulfotransferase [archaeon]HEC36887.1 sulfotransferase [bacterium]